MKQPVRALSLTPLCVDRLEPARIAGQIIRLRWKEVVDPGVNALSRRTVPAETSLEQRKVRAELG